MLITLDTYFAKNSAGKIRQAIAKPKSNITRPALHLSKKKHRTCLVTIHGRLGEQINARSIQLLRCLNGWKHHVSYIMFIWSYQKGVGLGSLRFLSLSFGFLPELADSVSGEFVSQLNEVMALIYKGTHNILLEATNA